MKDGLTWIELSKKNFIKNIKTIRRLIGNKVILAPCVKANAYGHGLVESAKILSENGSDWLCVDTVDEGILLKKYNIYCPILIMGYLFSDEIRDVIKNSFRIFLYDINLARAVSREAKLQRRQALVHIKVDTGMSRQGVRIDELKDFIHEIQKLPNIKIEGIATHYATSDILSNRKFYLRQKKKFGHALGILRNLIRHKTIINCANSGAILTDRNSHYDMVRPGIILYGYYPSEEVKKYCMKKGIRLLPVLSLYTKIVQVKEIKKGDGVSYGPTFIAPKNMKIAVLPIGYYDGIGRLLSNTGSMIIHGKRAKILGRVCMNMTMVDTTGIHNVKVGDTAVIIGRQGREEITADEIAKLSQTINYEVLTRLRENAKRNIVD